MRSLTFLLLIQLFKANSPLKSTTIWFPTNDANVDRCITHFISSYKQCYMVDNSISLSLPDLLRDQQLCRTALLNMISQGMAEIIWENIENYDDLNFNSARHPTKYQSLHWEFQLLVLSFTLQCTATDYASCQPVQHALLCPTKR